MSNFKESGLQFSFPKNWRVIKFDEHRFYKYVHGIGLKGVDFIGIKENGELLLIEVKNYADRFPQDGLFPYAALLENPIPFAEQIAQKFEDSFQLIEVIHKYYLRKFWFRKVAMRLMPFLPNNFVSKYDWGFWLKVYEQCANQTTEIDLVWWIEVGPKVSTTQRFNLHHQLHQYFNTYFQNPSRFIRLLDRHSDQQQIGITDDE